MANNSVLGGVLGTDDNVLNNGFGILAETTHHETDFVTKQDTGVLAILGFQHSDHGFERKGIPAVS